MSALNRRTFVQLSTSALLAAASHRLLAEAPEAPSISSQDGSVLVKGANYSWEYSQADDKFSLRDSSKRLIVSGSLQPAVVVAGIQDPSQRESVSGRATGHHVEGNRVTFTYEGSTGRRASRSPGASTSTASGPSLSSTTPPQKRISSACITSAAPPARIQHRPFMRPTWLCQESVKAPRSARLSATMSI